MPWIESHQKLEKHPKLLKLCSLTKWSRDEAIGKLHRLWWWALDYAEDGDLSKYEPEVIFSATNGDLDAKKLLEIFQETNFIEKNLLIHDWLDYAGRYLYSKYHSSNPKKLKRIQAKYRSNNRRTYLTTKGNLPNKPNQPNQDNLNTLSQINDLLELFNVSTKELIKIYWVRTAKKNKSGIITDGRKLTLLNEMYNSKERTNDDKLFDYALENCIKYDKCNIGYLNAIIKNKKTERPL